MLNSKPLRCLRICALISVKREFDNHLDEFTEIAHSISSAKMNVDLKGSVQREN